MSHAALVDAFRRVLKREAFVDRHLAALRYKKKHRDATIATMPEWQSRRETARRIKADVRARNAELLEQWTERARGLGTTVHRASDAAEANRLVLEIAKRHGASSAVKSKSMTTEECRLNDFLAEHEIRVTDTDLGERIVQLFGEPPSHLVTPAIHRSRSEIGELFHRMGLCAAGEEDPVRLTQAARRALREIFLGADLGITGANFLVAETGGLVVIENEANSLLGTSLTDVHVVVVGIEKLIPRLEDLATFLTVLAPSSTGQRLTTYSTHYHGPQPRTEAEQRAGFKARELHVVLLDNGRSKLVGTPSEEALGCIRCGACLNACPVYRRVGGHAYDWVYMGPIGEILAPGLGQREHDALPKASSLCGACNDVCPVKIDIAGHIHDWRGELRKQRRIPSSLPPLVGRLLARPRLWRGGIRAARAVGPISGFFARKSRALTRWEADGKRALPVLPKESFRTWWRRRDAGASAVRLARGSGPRAEYRSSETATGASLGTAELEPEFETRLREAGGEVTRLDDLDLEGVVATAHARELLSRRGLDCAPAPIAKGELDGVDALIATARVRVARKGACWVDFADLESRAQILLPETLVLLVPRDAIVEDLDEFYAADARHGRTACGTHVTGPSKTADIEQTLVFGAHGPKKLTVVAV